jgi:hypothetical protein
MIWTFDWIWSVTLIVFTMAVHVLVLAFVFRLIVAAHAREMGKGTWLRASVYVITFVLSAIILHAFESACWGAAYLALGALPDARAAMLYSLNAMTTFGHVTFELRETWKLMGALEALNGILLCGLTTAFMFALLVQLDFAKGVRRTFDS